MFFSGQLFLHRFNQRPKVSNWGGKHDSLKDYMRNCILITECESGCVEGAP